MFNFTLDKVGELPLPLSFFGAIKNYLKLKEDYIILKKWINIDRNALSTGIRISIILLH